MPDDLHIDRRESQSKMLAGIRVTPSMDEAIKQRANALKCTVSEYVRALVQRDLDAQPAMHARRISARSAIR